jgi:hypothetical protein
MTELSPSAARDCGGSVERLIRHLVERTRIDSRGVVSMPRRSPAAIMLGLDLLTAGRFGVAMVAPTCDPSHARGSFMRRSGHRR